MSDLHEEVQQYLREHPHGEQADEPAVPDEMYEQVLQYLHDHPGARQDEIARALKLTPGLEAQLWDMVLDWQLDER